MPNMRLVQLDIWIDILLVAYYYDRDICYLYNLLTYTFDQGHCQWKTNIFLEKKFRCNFPALAWIFAQMIYYASDAEFKWFALHKQDQCAHSAYNNTGYVDTKQGYSHIQDYMIT